MKKSWVLGEKRTHEVASVSWRQSISVVRKRTRRGESFQKTLKSEKGDVNNPIHVKLSADCHLKRTWFWLYVCNNLFVSTDHIWMRGGSRLVVVVGVNHRVATPYSKPWFSIYFTRNGTIIYGMNGKTWKTQMIENMNSLGNCLQGE